MSEQLQLSTKAYNPGDHLVKIKTKEGVKDYYPANWRLYEFRLRYPLGILNAEIVHMDIERNFVIVKATAQGDELGNGRGTGLKQGLLSQLDKVEKLAKSRAIADMGIGTEYALEASDDDLEYEGIEVIRASSPTVPVQQAQAEPSSAAPVQGNSTSKVLDPTIAKERLDSFYLLAKKLGICKTDQEFVVYVCKLLHLKSFDIKAFTGQHLTTIARDLKAHDKQAA